VAVTQTITTYFLLEKKMSFEIATARPTKPTKRATLLNLAEWTPEAAVYLAEEEKVPLSDNHWEVINFLREYYNEYQIAPAVRVLTKAIGKQFGEEKGNSKYLYDLFPLWPCQTGLQDRGPAQAHRLHLSAHLPGASATINAADHVS
jgi:TusE/DsrC/DsvC family sulfur relay protein